MKKVKVKKTKAVGDGVALGGIAHPVASVSEKMLFDIIGLVRLAETALNEIYEILGLNGDISVDSLETAEIEVKKNRNKKKGKKK